MVSSTPFASSSTSSSGSGLGFAQYSNTSLSSTSGFAGFRQNCNTNVPSTSGFAGFGEGANTNISATSANGSQSGFALSGNINLSSTNPFGHINVFGKTSNPDTAASFSTGGATFTDGTSVSLFGTTAAPFSSTRSTVSSPTISGSSSASLSSSSSASQNVLWHGYPGTSESASTGGRTFGFGAPIFGPAPASLVTTSMQATSSSPYLWSSSSGPSTSFQAPAGNASSSAGFSFGCTTTSGHSTVPFGTSPLFGTTDNPFAFQKPFSGDHGKAPIYHGLRFGVGSRVTSYNETAEEGFYNAQGNFLSISAMSVYKYKCHEELRWEDYQLGDKGSVPYNQFFPRPPSFSFPTSSVTSNPFLNTVTLSGPSPFWSTVPSSFPSSPFSVPPITSSSGLSTAQSSSFFSPPTPHAPPLPSNSNSLFRPNHSSCFNMPPIASSSGLNTAQSPSFFSPPAPPFPLNSNPLFGPNQSSCFNVPPFTSSSGLGTAQSSSFFSPPTPHAPPLPSNSNPLFGPNHSSCFNMPFIASSSGLNTAQSPSFFSPPAPPFPPNSNPLFGPNQSSCFNAPPVTSSSALNTAQSSSFFSPPTPPASPFPSNFNSFFGPNQSSCFISPPIPAATPFSFNLNPSEVATSIFQPMPFNYASFAPFPYIYSTSVTAPATTSIPCQFVPILYMIPLSTYSYMPSVTQKTQFVQPSSITSPSETPSVAPPQMLAEGRRTTPPSPSQKYGIASTPVSDRPSPLRRSSSLTIRRVPHHRQKWLPTLDSNHEGDGPKVALSVDAHKTPGTARTDLPRANPRALIDCSSEEWNLRANFNNISLDKHTSIHLYDNGDVLVEVSTPVLDGSLCQDKDGKPLIKDRNPLQPSLFKAFSVYCTHGNSKDLVELRVGDFGETSAAAHSVEHNSVNGDYPSKKEDNIDKLMPKLKCSEYFMKPRVEDLAVKEKSEPGFCSHVKNFVVGRHGYGSIKFLGETDVRQLDLESCIEFRDREVIVYMDGSKKPPVGEGLNKPAEITLSNIKCVDKTSGKQYIDGPKLDKYREMLMKKAAEVGAEFMSYDPVQGEWKFRVAHF